jgi:hypothetical protein
VEREQTLPKRTADSLRNFWKTVERKGLENYMRTALESNTWYCHAFCKIPKVKLVCTYRDNEADGELEREMIQLAESAIQRKTHRQQLLDAGKSYSKNDSKRSQSNVPNLLNSPYQLDPKQDDDVDLNISEN